jgi:hypothetical protein
MSRRGPSQGYTDGGARNKNEITKNIKQGTVEVDYEGSSLLVHYETEMVRDLFAVKIVSN